MKDLIKLRTIFMGTSSFAGAILEALMENSYNIVSVYTQPDKKVGRDQKMEKSAVKKIAEKNNLPVREPQKLEGETIEDIKNQKPDMIIVAAYGKILPKVILGIPEFGALNVHASLLPKFRGPSPIQNAILRGEKETGTTIMLMNEGIDTGEVLAQEKVLIDDKETYIEIEKKIADISKKLIIKTLLAWVERKITPRPQEEKEASFCQLIERSDGKIIWSDGASSIYDRWRAFILWPGIFSYYEKGERNLRLKFLKVTLADNIFEKKRQKGEVFKFQNNIAVQTGRGAIIIDELQLEGRGAMGAEEFANGYPDFIGSVLK